MEEEEIVSEMKVEVGEEVEKIRRFRRFIRRKFRKFDDYEIDLFEFYRFDDEDIDMNVYYDDFYVCFLCFRECYSENGLFEYLKRIKYGEVIVIFYLCLICNRFFVDFKILEFYMI